MARAKRNDTERELDLLFLVMTCRKFGPEFNGVKATRMLNAMRANVARQQTLALGGTEEDAEEAAREAQLSEQAVRRQWRLAKQRITEVGRMGLGLLLDEQMAEVNAELEESYQASQMILEDIERSRTRRLRRTRGEFRDAAEQLEFTEAGNEALALIQGLGVGASAEGQRLVAIVAETMAKTPVEPREMVTTVEDRAATAALYARLVAERGERRKLREELRQLCYGSDLVAASKDRRSYVQVLANEDDPEKAREIAIEALQDEARHLIASEEMGVGPWTPDSMRHQRARTTDVLNRLKLVRGLGEAAGSGGRGTFKFSVVELDAGSGAEQPIEVTAQVK